MKSERVEKFGVWGWRVAVLALLGLIWWKPVRSAAPRAVQPHEDVMRKASRAASDAANHVREDSENAAVATKALQGGAD